MSHILDKKTYKLGESLVAIEHIGSGGNAAVLRGFIKEEFCQEIALKLLDPRCVTTDDMEREYKKFDHTNLIRIEQLTNLSYLGFSYVPNWYKNILDCETDGSFLHPVSLCSPYLNKSDNWRQHKSAKSLSEFNSDQNFIFVTEYCPLPLSQYIRSSRSMLEINRILIGICSGLTAMHQEGIIHTDLSIDNIFLTEKGVAKIGDFGLTEYWKEGISNNLRDPEIAPPEFWEGKGDPRSDIFQLGLLAFKLATGKDMAQCGLLGMRSFDSFDNILNDTSRKLNISTKFVEICSKATEYFPEDRFSTANEFAEALKKICLEMKGEV